MAKKKSEPKTPDVLPADPKPAEKAKAETTYALTKSTNYAPVPVRPTDPLQRYMEELRRLPMPSPEEQIEIAKRFYESGDPALARELVSANLRLVVKIAMEYRNSYQNVLDLVQEGNMGLLKAVMTYDPYKGTRLSYYASWWIRSYILKFLLDNFRLVKVGTTQAQKKLFYNLMREKERLEAQGLEASPKLLADHLNVKESEVVEMGQRLGASGAEVSIDKPIRGEAGNATPGDLLTDEDALPVDENIARQELINRLREEVDEFLPALNEKERIIFQDRLFADEPKTLQEIADIFGVSRERMRQIEAKVVEKLREHMRRYLQDMPDEPEPRN